MLADATMAASGHTIGGDFWLQARRHDGATFIAVGDVSGHGETVAEHAGRVRRILLDAAWIAETPCALLEAANDRLMADHTHEDLFATAVAVLFEPVGRRMSWSYAGHLPPHRLDAGTPLDGARPGTPLGVQQPVGCTSSGASELERGEGVLLYTDGLEDAVGPGGDRFGTARVTHALSSLPDALPPVDIVDSLRRAVCDWSGRELPDDVCIVAVRAH